MPEFALRSARVIGMAGVLLCVTVEGVDGQPCCEANVDPQYCAIGGYLECGGEYELYEDCFDGAPGGSGYTWCRRGGCGNLECEHGPECRPLCVHEQEDIVRRDADAGLLFVVSRDVGDGSSGAVCVESMRHLVIAETLEFATVYTHECDVLGTVVVSTERPAEGGVN